MPAELFLTGATGFIGSGLLQRWLETTDARLHLLIRPRRDQDPQRRLDAVLGELYPDGAPAGHRRRIEVHRGTSSWKVWDWRRPPGNGCASASPISSTAPPRPGSTWRSRMPAGSMSGAP